jgi:hypothetical protein
MNYVCKTCIHVSKSSEDETPGFSLKALFSVKTEAIEDLERAERLKSALFYPRSVCEKYHEKLEGYEYIQIEPTNPFLLQDQKIRSILVLRRKCHKLFESLKCPDFAALLEEAALAYYDFCQKEVQQKCLDETEAGPVQLLEPKSHLKFSFDHLILREHIFTFHEIDNLSVLENKLKFLEAQLSAHFTFKAVKNPEPEGATPSSRQQKGAASSACKRCVIRDVLCFECNQECPGGKPNITDLTLCLACLKYFHKEFRPHHPDDPAKQKQLEQTRPYMAKSCLRRHVCAGLFEPYFQRNREEYEAEGADYGGFEDGHDLPGGPLLEGQWNGAESMI